MEEGQPGESLRRTNANYFPSLLSVDICTSKFFQKLLFIHPFKNDPFVSSVDSELSNLNRPIAITHINGIALLTKGHSSPNIPFEISTEGFYKKL